MHFSYAHMFCMTYNPARAINFVRRLAPVRRIWSLSGPGWRLPPGVHRGCARARRGKTPGGGSAALHTDGARRQYSAGPKAIHARRGSPASCRGIWAAVAPSGFTARGGPRRVRRRPDVQSGLWPFSIYFLQDGLLMSIFIPQNMKYIRKTTSYGGLPEREGSPPPEAQR